jgi:dienelactone hydrolase
VPLVFVPAPNNEEIMKAIKEGEIPFHKKTFDDPYEVSNEFIYGMKKYHQIIEAATIPVENIRCPLLILSGEQDKIWPSTFYGNFIEKRLKKEGSTIKAKHLHFPNAGHAFFEYPYLPITSQIYYHPILKFWETFGGTAHGNGHACKEAWSEVFDFLRESL